MKTILASAQHMTNRAFLVSSFSNNSFSAPTRQSGVTMQIFALLLLVLSMFSCFSTVSKAETTKPTAPILNPGTKIQLSTTEITLDTGSTGTIVEVTILGQTPEDVTLFAWSSNQSMAVTVEVIPGADSSKRLLFISLPFGSSGTTDIHLRAIHKHSTNHVGSVLKLTVPTAWTNPLSAQPVMNGLKPSFIGSIPSLQFTNRVSSYVWPFFAKPSVPVYNIAKAWGATGMPANHMYKNCMHASFTYSVAGIVKASVQYYKGVYLLHLQAEPKASGTVAVTMTLQYGTGPSTASVSQTFNVTVTADAALQPITMSAIPNTVMDGTFSTAGQMFMKQFQTNVPLSSEHFTVSYTNPSLMYAPKVVIGADGLVHSIEVTVKPGFHGISQISIVGFNGYSFSRREFIVNVLPFSVELTDVKDASINSSDGDIEISNAAETSSSVQKSDHESSARKDVLLQKETIAMKAFPNPASNVTTVKYNLPEADDTRIEIFTAQGMKLRTLSSGSTTKGQNTVDVDVSDLQSGTYMLTVSSKKYGVSSRSITVVR